MSESGWVRPILEWLDMLGVLVFALSGALAAARKRLDPVGLVLAATVTGVGGGTLRDVLLDMPVFWLNAWHVVLLTSAAALLVYGLGWFAPAAAERLMESRALLWLDAVGLAVFALLGADAALRAGAHPVIAAIMGMMTASFGGLIRDMLCNEIPLILHREIYASAALAGAALYVLSVGFAPSLALVLGGAAAFGLRALGIAFGWHLPPYPLQHRSTR